MPSRWAALRQLRVPLANCSRDAKWDSVRVFPNGKSIRRELITQGQFVTRLLLGPLVLIADCRAVRTLPGRSAVSDGLARVLAQVALICESASNGYVAQGCIGLEHVSSGQFGAPRITKA